MTPYHTADRCTIYHGDALDVLHQLPTASVDAVITDPPYSSGGLVRGDRMQDVKTKYVQTDQVANGTGGGALAGFSGDNRDQRGFGYWCALWLGQCRRVVVPGGVVAVFCDWRQLPVMTDVLQAAGLVWRGIVPWHKPNGRPVQGRWANQCEYIAWGTNGPRALDALGQVAFPGFFQANPPRERDHITQKPLEVMRQLVRIVLEGGVVLDPFAGAGTTGVAAVLEGRRFLGVEITEHYAGVAADRITTALRGYRDDGAQGVLPIANEPS